jgi:hypothetical protein
MIQLTMSGVLESGSVIYLYRCMAPYPGKS